jgi:hypothetical protein
MEKSKEVEECGAAEYESGGNGMVSDQLLLQSLIFARQKSQA